MKKTRLILVGILALVAIDAAFYMLPKPEFQSVFIFTLIPLALFLGYLQPELAVFVSLAGLIMVFYSNSFHLGFIGIAAVVFLAVVSYIPLHYRNSLRKYVYSFRMVNDPSQKQHKEMSEKLIVLKNERNELELEIDRISKLYVLGRELVEHMDMSEVIEHLQRILLDRPGVKSCNIFLLEKQGWRPLCLSNEQFKDQWSSFVNGQNYLYKESEPRLVGPMDWLEGQSVVFWPVRLEKKLFASIFLEVEDEYTSRYLEEGTVFLPQIALGLLRTKLYHEVTERSRIDGLTGLYRRAYFIERMENEIRRAERYKSHFSVLMLDIDFFKKVNDTYGHTTGDLVLNKLSKIFQRCIRPGDLAGRYGGEEFLILLHMPGADETMKIAAEIKKQVAHHVFHAGEATFSLSVSIGIARYPEDGKTIEDLLSGSDQALYWVKTNGRNGIKAFSKI